MTDDQRFAARRPDVLVYQTDVAGRGPDARRPLMRRAVGLDYRRDADWVVKLIDVLPAEASARRRATTTVRAAVAPLGGYQMMVRSEVIRGRFRNSYEKPRAVRARANRPRSRCRCRMCCTRFQKGHRIMIQVQSTWFPLVDRNPQKFVPNIYTATEADFIKATHKVYRSTEQPTHIEIGVLPGFAAKP